MFRKAKPARQSKDSSVKRKSAQKPSGSKSYLSKENLVSELGARWWYVMPEWPPNGYNYTPGLKQQGLRLVASERFAVEPETDTKGLKKVIVLEGYPGVFQDSKGKLYDLRPQESCPSITNFMKKDTTDLKLLITKAINAQLQACDESIKEDLHYKLKQLSK